MSANAEPKQAETPSSSATVTPPAEGPPIDVPAKPPLLLRARVATGKAVVTLFARMRATQETAVKKSLDWIAAADMGLAKSLVAGEKLLLSKLRFTPE